MAEKLVFEKYTLTLTHGIYEMGKEYELEKPIVVSYGRSKTRTTDIYYK